MVTDVMYANRGAVAAAFEAVAPVPIDRNGCPNCGGTAFSFLES